jgi:hypothetical protein
MTFQIKKMILKNIFFPIVLLFAVGCKNDTKPVNIVNTDSDLIENKYTSLPTKIQNNIFSNCNYLDYIFNDLPFSVSQNDRTGIMTNINFIGAESPKMINKNCKSLGREFFQINGDIVLEAEIYYSQECSYYIFYIDGKPLYSNIISQTGIDFYQQLINNAEKLKNNPNLVQ